jgi:hypothetical protein
MKMINLGRNIQLIYKTGNVVFIAKTVDVPLISLLVYKIHEARDAQHQVYKLRPILWRFVFCSNDATK